MLERIYYPAVFWLDDDGYSVRVPDLPGCFTQGETIQEANEMASDAIGIYLLDETDYPVPSEPKTIELDDGEFIMLVEFDKLSYMKKYDTKAVKKTLTIPAWLNYAAEENHINFSKLLQSALKEKLNIN